MINYFSSSGDTTDSFEVSATADTTTTSTSDVEVNSMSFTPPAGTYIAMFSASLSSTTPASNVFVSLYTGGTQIVHTSRTITSSSGGAGAIAQNVPVASQAKIIVNGSQAIDVRWRVSTISTATMHQRTLTLLRIS